MHALGNEMKKDETRTSDSGRMLPNFFILGAAKAGTTTLYEVLNTHPEIYLSRVKEPQFFCHEDLYRKGMEFYSDRFFRGCENYRVRGEATPHYLYYEKAAQRISTNLPTNDLKFLVVFRDPVKRAYSLYWNMVSEGIETLSFEDALIAEKDRSRSESAEYSCSIDYQYVDSGLYARQVRCYLKYFQPAQFHFVFFEDLKNSPETTFAGIFRFLGVGENADIRSGAAHNSAGTPRSKALHRFLRRPSALRRAVGRMLPGRVKYALVTKALSLNRQPHRYPPIRPETEAGLRRKFRDDILDLEMLTGRRLTHWLPES